VIFYKHYLADYLAATAHLSMLEDAAYSRLLRRYYTTEAPLPVDVAECCRVIGARSKDERSAVKTVLQEFFTLEEDGWHQKRCDEEIRAYKSLVEHNREAGKKGGRPPKIKSETAPETKPENNQSGFSEKPGENHSGYFREPGQNPIQKSEVRSQSKTLRSSSSRTYSSSYSVGAAEDPGTIKNDRLRTQVLDLANRLRMSS
jgi:uncharacterized protein YdaU (DUF1376 family)